MFFLAIFYFYDPTLELAMFTFIKRLVFTIFCLLLALPSVFYIQRDYYAEWLIAYILLSILLIPLSIRFIPSKKKRLAFSALREEYEKLLKQESAIRADASRLEMACPSCSEKHSYWGFMSDEKCNKCGSDLWATVLAQYDQAYDDLLRRYEKIQAFRAGLSSSDLRKLSKRSS